jgi:hypothetical protein
MYRDRTNAEHEIYVYGHTSLIGATGIVTKCLKENLEAIPGKNSIVSLQKTAILGTSHIVREVLQSET